MEENISRSFSHCKIPKELKDSVHNSYAQKWNHARTNHDRGTSQFKLRRYVPKGLLCSNSGNGENLSYDDLSLSVKRKAIEINASMNLLGALIYNKRKSGNKF